MIILSAAPRPFCVELSPSVHLRFYIAELSIVFFLRFHQWRSHSDRVLILSLNILVPLSAVLSWAWTWPDVLAWRMGVITAIVEPWSCQSLPGRIMQQTVPSFIFHPWFPVWCETGKVWSKSVGHHIDHKVCS